MGIVIGLDAGTSGTKAIAMNESGELLASALVEYPLHAPKPNWAEQDPADWERAAFAALAELAGKVDAGGVKGIGLTGQMHGSVFLDADNKVIRNALLWCDQRTAAQCDAITAKVGEARLLEMVSNPALTGFTAPKILWLRDNEPANYERVKKVLLPKDYIRLLLTGEYGTDVADASGTLLFDVQHRCWHKELMSLLNIDPDFMPPSYEGPEITGTLTAAAAEKTGLPAGIPVVAGGGDQAANGVGCGIVRTGVISSSLGTSGVVFAFADDVSTDPEGRVHTFCHSVPGKWHVMGVMLSAGGSLRWYRDALCQADIERGQDGRQGSLRIHHRRGRRHPHRRGRPRLPPLPHRRTHAPQGPRRQGRLHRPVPAPYQGPHEPGRVGGRLLRHARQPGNHARHGRARERGALLRRRRPQRPSGARCSPTPARPPWSPSTWTKARPTARRFWRAWRRGIYKPRWKKSCDNDHPGSQPPGAQQSRRGRLRPLVRGVPGGLHGAGTPV